MQGQPVIVQAGASRSGRAFAARHAEVMFTVQQDVDEARRFREEIRAAAAANGRDASRLKVLPGLMPVVGATREEARAKLDALARHVDDEVAMHTMSDRLGHDMSRFPLDGPVPDLPLCEHVHGYSRVLFAKARRESQSLRDLYNLFAAARGYLVCCGTPADVADLMESWVDAGACDGFMVLPAHFPAAFDEFVDTVVPELQRRGAFRSRYEGRTLRDHFGLAVPEKRHARR